MQMARLFSKLKQFLNISYNSAEDQIASVRTPSSTLESQWDPKVFQLKTFR